MGVVNSTHVSSALVGPGYEHRGGEVLGRQLTNRLEEAYRSERAMAREDLCVVKGQQCWVLYVDALVRRHWLGSDPYHPTSPPSLPMSGSGGGRKSIGHFIIGRPSSTSKHHLTGADSDGRRRRV